MREAHVGHVLGELVGELAVGERPVALERVQPPRAEVHLVDRDRARERASAARRRSSQSASCHSYAESDDDGGVLRRELRRGTRAGRPSAAACRPRSRSSNLYRAPGATSGEEELPDPGRAERAHRVQAAVPAVEVADHADRARRSAPRPRSATPATPSDLADVRAEAAVQLLVPALAGEVEVELADRRQERVRVAQHVRVARRDSAPRARSRAGAFAPAITPSKTPVAVLRLELDAHRQDADRLGVRAGTRGRRRRPSPRARRGRRAGRRARTTLRHVVTGSSSSRRRIPATGIGSQSGRMLSS